MDLVYGLFGLSVALTILFAAGAIGVYFVKFIFWIAR